MQNENDEMMDHIKNIYTDRTETILTQEEKDVIKEKEINKKTIFKNSTSPYTADLDSKFIVKRVDIINRLFDKSKKFKKGKYALPTKEAAEDMLKLIEGVYFDIFDEGMIPYELFKKRCKVHSYTGKYYPPLNIPKQKNRKYGTYKPPYVTFSFTYTLLEGKTIPAILRNGKIFKVETKDNRISKVTNEILDTVINPKIYE